VVEASNLVIVFLAKASQGPISCDTALKEEIQDDA
jgi:hypothetical protein